MTSLDDFPQVHERSPFGGAMGRPTVTLVRERGRCVTAVHPAALPPDPRVEQVIGLRGRRERR